MRVQGSCPEFWACWPGFALFRPYSTSIYPGPEDLGFRVWSWISSAILAVRSLVVLKSVLVTIRVTATRSEQQELVARDS